jgi:hypothetical protein
MRMAPSVAWAPPSLTLPRKGGGDEIAGSTSLSLIPSALSLTLSALSLIPSPLRGEGKGGGGAASRPLDFETRIRT